MRIGFTGTREKLELHQQKKIVSVLESLVDTMTYAITGACLGVDAFIAHWLAEHTQVQQVIVFPSRKTYIDNMLYSLPRSVFVEMPSDNKEIENISLAYRRRNQKIVDLSERLVAFAIPSSRGTYMTVNMGRIAGIVNESDIYKL